MERGMRFLCGRRYSGKQTKSVYATLCISFSVYSTTFCQFRMLLNAAFHGFWDVDLGRKWKEKFVAYYKALWLYQTKCTSWKLFLIYKFCITKQAGKAERKRPLGRTRSGCEGNIKINFGEIGCEDVDLIYLTQNKVQWGLSWTRSRENWRIIWAAERLQIPQEAWS
jgi:hypothetical protein